MLAAANTLPGDTSIAQWLQKILCRAKICRCRRAMTATVVLAVGGAVSLILWLGGYRRKALLAALSLYQYCGSGQGARRSTRPDGNIDIRAGYSALDSHRVM
jgi:hypothetical protein